MTGFWTPIFAFFQQVFAVWGQSLRESAPFGLGEHLRLVTPPHVIDLADMALLEQAILESPTDREVLVRLDKGLMIRRSFQISKEGLREVGKVVALEAERVLPLKMEALEFSYEIKDQMHEGLRRVDIVAARKSLIKDTFSIAHKYGLEIADIVARSDDEGPDTKFSLAPVQRRKALRISAILAVTVLIVTVLTAFPKVYQSRLESEIADLDIAIREARKNTETLAALQRQVKEMQSLSQAVNAERGQSQLVDLIVELTEASPDNVTFDEFRVEGRTVFLSGTAAAPEEWVIELENQEAFQNVILLSVRGQESVEGRKFEVRLEAVWPRERGASNGVR